MQTHIQIPVGDEVLAGELFTPNVVTASIVVCHGWTSNNTKYLPLAHQLLKLGVLTFAINLRGMGDSMYSIEKYSRKDHLNDLLAAIDYVAKLNNKPIIVLGKSYGGYLSSLATDLRKIDFLILSQPALYPDVNFNSPNAELIRNNPDIFRSRGEKIMSNKALTAISLYKNPLYIIQSEHDERST